MSKDKTQKEAIVSLQQRLERLEALLSGAGLPASHAKTQPSSGDSSLSLQNRTDAVQQKLKEIAKQADSVKNFLDNYDRDMPLLLPATPYVTSVSPTDPSITVQSQMLTDSLPSLKLLHSQLTSLAEIESSLLARGSEQMVEANHAVDPILAKTSIKADRHSQQMTTTSDKAWELVDRYNQLVNTTSEIFIAWNHLLTAAEDQVGHLERAKRAAVS